jgi:hypothetical protein
MKRTSLKPLKELIKEEPERAEKWVTVIHETTALGDEKPFDFFAHIDKLIEESDAKEAPRPSHKKR